MAIEGTLKDRGSTHGDYTEMARLAQMMKGLVREASSYGSMSAPQRESVDMVLLKIARICTGEPSFPDHWDDIEGYARLGNRQNDIES